MPPFVVAVVASLVLAAVAALWLGLTLLVALHVLNSMVQAVGVGLTGAPIGRDVGLKGVLLILNGLANLYLAYQLLRGWDPARWLVSGICGWWIRYWLYQASRASHAFGQLTGSPLRQHRHRTAHRDADAGHPAARRLGRHLGSAAMACEHRTTLRQVTR